MLHIRGDFIDTCAIGLINMKRRRLCMHFSCHRLSGEAHHFQKCVAVSARVCEWDFYIERVQFLHEMHAYYLFEIGQIAAGR